MSLRAMNLSRRTFSTINTAEIAHFSRLSSLWWDERGEFSFLHKMNPVRMQFIRTKMVEIAQDANEQVQKDFNPLKGLDVLDVGCGGGLLSESLARLGARTLGIDASESNISIAEHHASCDPGLSASLSYRTTAAENLVKDQKRYDVVCSMEVLEHVDNPVQFLETCSELLKPSGHLFLSTISRTPLSYFLTIFMAEQVLRKVSSGTHTHSKYIKPSELLEFFQERSWISPFASVPRRTEAEVRGLIYNPLRSSWFLGPRNGPSISTDCNYILWVRKPPQ